MEEEKIGKLDHGFCLFFAKFDDFLKLSMIHCQYVQLIT